MEKITIWTNCTIFIQRKNFKYESTNFIIKSMGYKEEPTVEPCGIIDLDKEKLKHLSLYSFYDKLKILIRLFLNTYQNHICTIVFTSTKLTNDDNCFKLNINEVGESKHFMKLKIQKETNK